MNVAPPASLQTVFRASFPCSASELDFEGVRPFCEMGPYCGQSYATEASSLLELP